VRRHQAGQAPRSIIVVAAQHHLAQNREGGIDDLGACVAVNLQRAVWVVAV